MSTIAADSAKAFSERINLSAAIVALLIMTIFFVSLDRFLSELPTSYKLKRNLLLQSSNQINILILGSSHGMYGIRPDKFSLPAVNLANASQSIEIDELLLNKYLENHKNVRVVVLPISYFSPSFRLTHGCEEWRDCLYFRILGVSEKAIWRIVRDKRYWGLPFVYGSARTRQALLGDFSSFPTPKLDGFGWSFGESKEGISTLSAMKRIAGQHEIMHSADRAAVKASLKRIVQTCARNRIRLVLVTLPVYETYSAQADPRKVHEMRSFAASVCGPNVACQDYFDDARFALDDFSDNDHLNAKGAAKVTSLINSAL